MSRPPHRGPIRLTAGISMAAAVMLLSSCSPIDPMAVKIVDGRLLVVVCTEMPVDVVSLTVVPSGESGAGSEPIELWRAEGDGEVGPGAPIIAGVAPAGMETAVPLDANDFSGDRIHVSVVNTAVDAAVWVGDGANLREDAWLTGTGAHSSIPCTLD